jgi:hypothetical protein
MTDFYGDKSKFFIGVVKDTQDPTNSNYVRVRIKGIHPETGDDSPTSPTGSGGGIGAAGTGGMAATPITGAGPAVAPISVDRGSLPTAAQLDQKISNNWTLRHLTTGAAGAHSSRTAAMGIQKGLLTQDIIYNLANLSRNCLDKIKDDHHNLRINSGWRIGVSPADRSASGGNHPKGYAADISAPGVSPRELANYCNTNLRGRFNLLLIYPTFIHIQLGGSSRQGTTSNPLIRNN